MGVQPVKSVEPSTTTVEPLLPPTLNPNRFERMPNRLLLVNMVGVEGGHTLSINQLEELFPPPVA
jgi:hypothetical protein